MTFTAQEVLAILNEVRPSEGHWDNGADAAARQYERTMEAFYSALEQKEQQA